MMTSLPPLYTQMRSDLARRLADPRIDALHALRDLTAGMGHVESLQMADPILMCILPGASSGRRMAVWRRLQDDDDAATVLAGLA